MDRLSKSEEINILRQVIAQNEFIGAGSSRAVYGLGEDKVVKVAWDRGGMIQNHYEVEIAKNTPYLTALVYSYGSFIIVAERLVDRHINGFDVVGEYEGFLEDIGIEDVGCEDYIDFNYIIDHFDDREYADNYQRERQSDLCNWARYRKETVCKVYNFQDFRKDFEDLTRTLSDACEELGYTQDNMQMAYSESRSAYVLYDAGFNMNEHDDSDRRFSMVGNVDYYIYGRDITLNDSIGTLIYKLSNGRLSA